MMGKKSNKYLQSNLMVTTIMPKQLYPITIPYINVIKPENSQVHFMPLLNPTQKNLSSKHFLLTILVTPG